RHTRCYRDWSSDVCSSDLGFEFGADYFLQEVFQPLAAGGEFFGLRRVAEREFFQETDGAEGKTAAKMFVLALADYEFGAAAADEIGRASCREVVAVACGDG